MNWGWPQIAYLVLVVMGLTVTAIRHGERRRGNYNIYTAIAGVSIVGTILYFGGFFSA